MNNWDTSPVLQTNEVARRVTPNSEDSAKPAGHSLDGTRDPKKNLLIGTEDLQKIRRSNHSTGSLDMDRDAMECENDASLDRLMYPGLESSMLDVRRDVDCDFFEDDYFAAQEAVRLNESISSCLDHSSRFALGSDDNNHAVHRRTFDAFASLEDDLAVYESRQYGSLRRQPDVTQQKLRR